MIADHSVFVKIANKIVFLFQREKVELNVPCEDAKMLLIKNLNPKFDKQATVKNCKKY